MIKIEMKDINFIPWFIGFVDAEGNFNISKKKRFNNKGELTKIYLGYEFHISLHQRDKNLLEFIQSKLNPPFGLGKIYEYENKNEVHLVINKEEDINWLINNIFSTKIENSLFLTQHQASKYELLKFGFTNDIKYLDDFKDYETILNKEKAIDYSLYSQDFIDNWIVGFMNGEVSFTYFTKDNKKYPRISLEHTDQKAIELIRDRLKIGPKILIRTRDSRKTTYSLFIQSKKDINNTIYFLNNINNFSGYKLIQFNDWKNKFGLN